MLLTQGFRLLTPDCFSRGRLAGLASEPAGAELLDGEFLVLGLDLDVGDAAVAGGHRFDEVAVVAVAR
jgi:hypothetical protein